MYDTSSSNGWWILQKTSTKNGDLIVVIFVINMFARTLQLLAKYFAAFPEEKIRTERQNAVYIEFASLQRLLIAYTSFVNDTDMMRLWVRMYSCLPIVRQSMTENGHTSGVFGGIQRPHHKLRRKMPWTDKFGDVISSINLRLIASAKFARIIPGSNDAVELLLLNARFELIMQQGPTKTLLDRIIEGVMLNVAKELAMPPAGTKSCPGA
jgi:hypothetical protein